MASATMSNFENNPENMTQNLKSVDTDICKPICGDLNIDPDIVEEETLLNDADEIDPNDHQFSNNATTLGISIKPDNSNVIKPESYFKKKSESVESKQQEKKEKQVEFEDMQKPRIESPDVTTPNDVTSEETEDDAEYFESAGDERIACIEEEYIQRISILEQRHNELENVLERLTTAVECGIVLIKTKESNETASKDADKDARGEEGDEAATKEDIDTNEVNISRGLILDLFVEFQHKIRNFAEDLNGVLNCSEAAIRHGRVVQEWATSVQMMFEQLKEERHKILNYIDERERNMIIIKEQFIAELEEQGKTLKQLVEEMMSHHELQKEGEEYCKAKADSSSKRSTVEKIVDLLLARRLEEDKSIIMNLNKQSKISEMKLFIIHQQSCIQQLQEQNKELRAIIEGLMGPDDVEEENPCDSEQSGTPASADSQDEVFFREKIGKQDSPCLSLVSDVLYCDRGEYLPGSSTDGDVATLQAYDIGRDSGDIAPGENIVFDPLSVSYVREQCQHAEETERRAHLTVPKDDIQPVIDSYQAKEDDDVKQDSVEKPETEEEHADSIEPDVELIETTNSEVEQQADRTAAGDGVDVLTEKAVSPKADDNVEKSEVNKEEVVE